MNKNIFISGWAGFKELFPNLQKKDIKIFVPFLDFMPEETKKYFKNYSGSCLLGWSTGSHIVLNNLDIFYENFDKLLLFAPFDEFTKFYDKKILKLMRRKLKISPFQVLYDFMIKSGMNETDLIPKKNIPIDKLDTGLEYLENCKLKKTEKIKDFSKLHFIQGIKDEIVFEKSIDDMKNKFKNSKVYKTNSPHFFNEKIIEYYYETIS
jgi:hypothetical protein